MADSINRSALEALRAYVEQQSDTIMELTLRGAPSLQYMTPVPGVTGERLLEWAQVNDLIKPWAAAFAPDADTIERTPIRVRSYFQKAELQFTPKQDFFNYKGYLAKTKMSAEDYPFAQWCMDKATKRIRTQMEFQQLFTGDRVDPPTAADEMFNGLLTLIADDLAAGTPVLTPVTTGALVSSTIIDQIEQMDDAIDEEYRSGTMRMYCAPEVFRMYRRKYRAEAGFHPMNETTDTMNEIMIDGSMTMLTSCPGMTGSQRLILTPEENVYYAYDGESDTEVWEFETDHRNLDAWCDHWFGAGFFIFDPRILYVNDQA